MYVYIYICVCVCGSRTCLRGILRSQGMASANFKPIPMYIQSINNCIYDNYNILCNHKPLVDPMALSGLSTLWDGTPRCYECRMVSLVRHGNGITGG